MGYVIRWNLQKIQIKVFQLGWKKVPNSYDSTHYYIQASLVAQTKENLPAVQETWVPFLDLEDLCRKVWQPTPVFSMGESPWTEYLEGYRPWRHKESDMTEQLSALTHYCIYYHFCCCSLLGVNVCFPC